LLAVRTQTDGGRCAGARQDGPEAASQPAAADSVDQGLDAAVGELVGAPRGEGAAAAGQAAELGRVQPQVTQRQQAQLVHLRQAGFVSQGQGQALSQFRARVEASLVQVNRLRVQSSALSSSKDTDCTSLR